MAILEWDKVGERTYQAGLDRGVLYLNDGTVVPWNGLISVEESSDAELKSFYLDGVKMHTEMSYLLRTNLEFELLLLKHLALS